MANINETAEQSLPSASFCSRASGAESDAQILDSCTHPDLLPYLEKPQPTGKRSRKQKNINMKLISGSTPKRLRPRELADDSVTSRFRQKNCDGKCSLTLALMMSETLIHLSETLIHFQPKMVCLWKLLAFLIVLEMKLLFTKKRESLLVLKIICPLEQATSIPWRKNL